MTAARVCASVAVLHSRFVDAGSRSDDMRDVPLVLDRQFETVGPNIFRANIRLFFDLIDQCWGLKNIVYRESAPQVKGTFIRVLADLFQSYDTFWRDKRLFVNAGWMKKLAKFNLQDPTVINLCGSGGKARQILFHLLLDHMNSGRRNGKLAADDTIDGDNGDE